MKWVKPDDVEISSELLSAVGGSELLARLLTQRGISDPAEAQAFLDPSRYQPAPPEELPGMTEAADLLAAAIRKGERIGVWGDFDVDGQTSTTLLVSGLEQLGADVVFHIPVRATESHGITIPYLESFLNQGVKLLLTCDTGISAHRAVDFAKERSVKVVITDHHDLPPELPRADALINSKLLPAEHPLSSLPGVGVAYKLIEALYIKFKQSGKTEQFLDLVALGIVADVALLHGDARYLLQRGLTVLQKTERLGLQVLFELAEIFPSYISEEEIGFSIAPRMNALGRLADANLMVEFLTTSREGRARVIANQLEGLNAQRKLLTSQVFQAALSQLERNPELLTHAALVLVGEQWPAGVVGIVASKLVERFNKPTILLTKEGGQQARGSARSVPGCDISRAIAACENLLDGYGGHPMAAGMALPAAQIDRFRKALSSEVEAQLGSDPLEPILEIDLGIELTQIDFPLVEQIERLAPFGHGNPPLIMSASDLKLASHSKLGKLGEHRRLVVEDQLGTQQSVLWWGGASWDLPQGEFEMAFTTRISAFQGERQLQVELRDYNIISDTENEELQAKIQLVDCRENDHPPTLLAEILESAEDALIWAEGSDKEKVSGVGRKQLTSAKKLVIWTNPPSRAVLKTALHEVEPDQVFLFAIDPVFNQPKKFLNHLAGMCRFAISKQDGEINLSRLGVGLAQTEGAVRLGLEWLQAKGYISIEEEGITDLRISEMDQSHLSLTSPENALSNLSYLLSESAAFRRFMRSSEVSTLDSLFRLS
jgi:single-stranded-DNA-specific exonuclease